MSNVTVTINNLAMQTVLDGLDNKLERVGQFGENTAKENCPVDKGILRASIFHTDPVNHSIKVGTNIDYAIPVHEGHGNFTGKPFLKDAVYNHIAEIQNILGGR